jgi:hypothetical protein
VNKIAPALFFLLREYRLELEALKVHIPPVTVNCANYSIEKKRLHIPG